MMAAETSSEMINSVHSGLAVLTTSSLTSFSISLNIRPWETVQVGQAEAGQFFDLAHARFPSSSNVALQQTTPAVRSIHVTMLRPIEGPSYIHRSLQRGFVYHVPGPTKLTSWDGNSSPEWRFLVFPQI